MASGFSATFLEYGLYLVVINHDITCDIGIDLLGGLLMQLGH